VESNPSDNSSAPAPTDEDLEESGQRFLTLPFNDSKVKIVAGWYYDNGVDRGVIDYTLGGVRSGRCSRWRCHAT